MRQINLPDDVFTKLQKLAEPLVDTPVTVIDRLADEKLREVSGNGPRTGSAEKDVIRLDPDRPDNLTHTKILSAKVDRSGMYKPKWNGLLDKLHHLAFERRGSFEEVEKISGANLHQGRFEKNGYRYLPDVDFSIQGVDSNLAWEHSLQLAKALRIPLELKIEWRQKDGAARPGEKALLEWHPNEG